MKTTIIRALAVAMLATSMSAFAVTNDSKAADSAPCATTKQNDSAAKPRNTKKEKKDDQKQKEQNSDQFSGIWG